MASPATHLAKIDTAIDEILTAMADVDATQTVKIRGREVERVDLQARLDSLIKARASMVALASRESTPAIRPARYGFPTY